MHRSGTSLLAAALECLGVVYGDRLIGPRADNPKGFWEDQDIVACNDALYAVLEGFSSSLGFDEQALLMAPECAELRRRIGELLDDRLASYSIFGIKDPRMPRLMQVWMALFEERGIEVDFVVPLRNPLSVAASLAARDRFPIGKGLLLWYEHMYRTLAFVRGRRAFFVDYDRFLGEALPVLRSVGERLNLTLNHSLFQRFTEEVIDANLRHSTFDETALAGHPDSFPALERLFSFTRRLASGAGMDTDAVCDSMVALDDDFAALWPLLRHCGAQDIELWNFWQKEGALTEWTRQLDAKVQHQGSIIESMSNTISDMETAAAQHWAQWQTERRWLESELAWYQAERQRLDGEMGSLDSRYRALLASSSWRLTAPLRKLRRIWDSALSRN